MSIYLSVYLSICLSVYLFICLSVHLSFSIIHLHLYLSITSIYISMYMYVIYLFVPFKPVYDVVTTIWQNIFEHKKLLRWDITNPPSPPLQEGIKIKLFIIEIPPIITLTHPKQFQKEKDPLEPALSEGLYMTVWS